MTDQHPVAVVGEREGLVALAVRCEAAGGPDRELDLAIGKAIADVDARAQVNPLSVTGFGYVDRNQYSCAHVRLATASLDAVLALYAEKLPGWCWAVTNFHPARDKPFHAELSKPYDWDGHTASASTGPLALCAALLRALAATRQKGADDDRSR